MSKGRKPKITIGGKNKQLKFSAVNGWGGRRKGSGRPNLTDTVNHMKRPTLGLKTPLHLTLRIKERLPSLRSKGLFKEFKKSLQCGRRQGLYVIHFSIQRNHIHLFAEAENNKALALGMRSLAGRFAKKIREQAAERGMAPKGSAFNGRYHLHVLKTPREVKNALEYVLLNMAKHQELIEYMDPYSSAKYFRDWKELLGPRYRSLIRACAGFYSSPDNLNAVGNILSPSRSWLAREGWKRAS